MKTFQEIIMRIEKTYAAALALAGALAVTATTPSLARTNHAMARPDASYAREPVYQGDAYDAPIVLGRFAPGSTGYGRQAYNPEQPTDPDPRIGGALKMSTDR
jgi:hypothetical protein